MNIMIFIIHMLTLSICQSSDVAIEANPSEYLSEVKAELQKEWPNNKTINLVFHGHSVPAGYFKTPVVNTLGSYSFQLLKKLKALYPNAVINIINTSIGGEHSEKGESRFKHDVLTHKPDVLFIDYALNDRRIGLVKAKHAWESMIQASLDRGIKVILLTPSPDESVDLLEEDTVLDKHAIQIKHLSIKYGVGFVDSYELFKQKVVSGESVSIFMSQGNHPNEKGHEVIADGIMDYFK